MPMPEQPVLAMPSIRGKSWWLACLGGVGMRNKTRIFVRGAPISVLERPYLYFATTVLGCYVLYFHINELIIRIEYLGRYLVYGCRKLYV